MEISFYFKLSIIKQYVTTAADDLNYQVKHYSLQAIIAVGFKIENERAVQFRKWANQIVKDYTIQGWTMDVLIHQIDNWS